MRAIQRFQAIFVVFLLVAVASGARALDPPKEVAHKFFQSVWDKDFATSWSLLTKKTQDDLITTIATQEKIDPASVREAFRTNDPKIQDGFWAEFRTSSNSKLLASLKFTDAGQTGKTAKVRGGAVDLLMFNEKGWKFGLEETFFPAGFGQDANKG